MSFSHSYLQICSLRNFRDLLNHLQRIQEHTIRVLPCFRHTSVNALMWGCMGSDCLAAILRLSHISSTSDSRFHLTRTSSRLDNFLSLSLNQIYEPEQHSVDDLKLDGADPLVMVPSCFCSNLSTSARQLAMEQSSSVHRAVGFIIRTDCIRVTPCLERFHLKYCFEWVISVASHTLMLYLQQARAP